MNDFELRDQLERKVTRRTTLKFLGFAAGIPIATSILAACGGDDDDSDDTNEDSGNQSTPTPFVNAPVTSGGTPLTTFGTAVTGASPEADDEDQESGSGGEGQSGGTLLLASSVDPDALDPAGTIQAAADSFNDLLYQRLVYIGSDRAPPALHTHGWRRVGRCPRTALSLRSRFETASRSTMGARSTARQ